MHGSFDPRPAELLSFALPVVSLKKELPHFMRWHRVLRSGLSTVETAIYSVRGNQTSRDFKNEKSLVVFPRVPMRHDVGNRRVNTFPCVALKPPILHVFD